MEVEEKSEDTRSCLIKDTFGRVIKTIKNDSNQSSSYPLPDETKLRLYGLYKQATNGRLLLDGNCQSKPAVWNIVAYRKYNAWMKCGEMSQDEAMLEYMTVLAGQDGDTATLCTNFLQELAGTEVTESSYVTASPDCITKSSPSRIFQSIPSLIPRGRIDISYRDLLYSFLCCMKPSMPMSIPILESPLHAVSRLEDEIASSWKNRLKTSNHAQKEDEIIVGLSVRSLLDLYLLAKNYPAGSEVIIVPPINIEGMIRIMEYHKLKIIPIDIPKFHGNEDPVIRIDFEAVGRAITECTVAVMVVHPFGILSATDTDMERLRKILTDNSGERKIDIWEDCAECFTGGDIALPQCSGSRSIDIQFYSFGTVKTATALGGGVAILPETTKEEVDFSSEKVIATKMRRIQCTIYGQQMNTDFVAKVIKAFILLLLSDNPKLLWVFARCFGLLGLNYDSIITSATKGFLPSGSDRASEVLALLRNIRKRPSPALLSLLKRRIACSSLTSQRVETRVRRCHYLKAYMSKNSTLINSPCEAEGSRHLYWLFPILVSEPNIITKRMRDCGYDVPRGTSQLGCISSFVRDGEKENSCPNTQRMMDRILYLPIASYCMSNDEIISMMRKLTECVHDEVTIRQPLRCNGRGERNIRLHFLVLLIGTVIIFNFAMFDLLVFGSTAIIVCLVFLFVTLCLLRVSIAPSYMNSSSSVAKFISMNHPQNRYDSEEPNNRYHQAKDLLNQVTPLPNVKEEMEQNLNCFRSKNGVIILTGATGFIGSSILRDVLQNKDQLGISRVVVIIRRKRNQSASERIRDLLSRPMFSFLEADQDTVTVIEGDLSKPNIGMTKENWDMICEQLNVTHVINCAACVNFTESLDNAAESNITSALELQRLVKRLKSKALYVYISTAFIHGNNPGSSEKPLQDELFNFGKYNPTKIYKSMMDTQSYASMAMTDLGFPNTYTFSKSVCEHLLLKGNEVETLILRPSIVGPAIEQPYEGWAGEKPSTLVAGACLYLKFPFNIWSFRKERAPVIPVDVVSRYVLKKAFQLRLKPNPDIDDEHSSFSEDSFIVTNAPCQEKAVSTDFNLSEKRIFTIAWDASSPISSTFTWYQYACAILQLASMKGHVDRVISYVVFLISFKIFLTLNLSYRSFCKLHRLLVHFPLNCLRYVCEIPLLRLTLSKELRKATSYLDLPILFFPFTTKTYYFQTELIAPKGMNGERYMFSSILAAELFLNEIKKRAKTTNEPNEQHPYLQVIAGEKHIQLSPDLWWSLTQPKGNIFIRFLGWTMIKVLRVIASEVTVDIDSFVPTTRIVSELKHDQNLARDTCIVIAPTHRSFLDFMLISFIAFAIPELGIEIPHIAAADDFSRIPLLGWLASFSGAFFLKRGRGTADPKLFEQVSAIKRSNCKDKAPCLEVFIEGKRSRDRRFVKPKTGFFKCLCDSKDDHIIVPVSISYEATPEQSVLSNEREHKAKEKMNAYQLLKWLKGVFCGRVKLGKIHISAAKPLSLKRSDDVLRKVMMVQQLQSELILVSRYHTMAGAKILGVSEDKLKCALLKLGCPFWHNDSVIENCPLPVSLCERWALFLHYGQYFAHFVGDTHPDWAKWLDPCNLGPKNIPRTKSIDIISSSLKRSFDAANESVNETVNMLQRKGFTNPSLSHILQYAMRENTELPYLLINAAASMYLQNNYEVENNENNADESDLSSIEPLFREKESVDTAFSSESFGAWGYADSRFIVNAEEPKAITVTMRGNRYHLSGRMMPNLIPFLENETQITFDPVKPTLPLSSVPDIADSDLSSDHLLKLYSVVGGDMNRISISAQERARHGTGHSQEDMYMIRSNTLSKIRLPDAVAYPNCENEVTALISLAMEENWCLIPFGGGTNVSHATWCPPKELDPRPMISVDMKLLNKIIAINEEDRTVHVQAGITGSQLLHEMEARGYTIGHEPDSLEFSTVGGWIATKASGMKQNRYGNIEDIVKGIRVSSANGHLWQNNNGNGPCFGRVSTGTDFSSIVFGSEGSLGIITSATLKIWDLPEVKDYESVILHTFEDGIRFMRDVSLLGPMKPASVRLLDNVQFRLGQAMKSSPTFTESLKRSFFRLIGNLFAERFDPNRMVCVTLTFEGQKSQVKEQISTIQKIASKHGGFCAGPGIGKSGYEMTYAIAYIRDFAMTYGFLAESFETFVPWSKARHLITETKHRIIKEHQSRALPGLPLVCCRVTQVYDQGVCVYFYFCMSTSGVLDPSDVFGEIEHAAREEILQNGGSLSHHHGIGKVRASFMGKVNSHSLQKVFVGIKESFDPANVFGARNGTFSAQETPSNRS